MKHRFLSLLLVAVLCLLPSLGMAEVAKTGLPISTEPIEITAAVGQSPIQVDFNEIIVLKNFAEASGVTLKFTNIPAADRDTQRSLMLNSGDMPEVLMKMMVTSTDQGKYGSEGVFLALSDYAEYTPNLNAWFEKYPTAKDAMVQADGKYYAAPYILAGESIRMGEKIFFNTDVIQKLGYDAVPTTTEGLLEFLRKAKNLDYNENGKADEIPLTGAEFERMVRVFSGSFGLYNRGGSHGNVFVKDDGSLAFAWSSEEYREMLRYFNTLYTEQLLDQDIFTMDFAQLIAKAAEGRALTYCMVNNSPVAGTKYEEFAVGNKQPFEGPKGHNYWGNYTLPSRDIGEFVITYKCKNPEAAARWIDHWYSEEGIISYFMGVEGETYEKDANSPGGLRLTDNVLKNPDGLNFEQVLAPYVPWAGGANPSVATNEFFKGGETWPASVACAEGLINYVPETIWTPFTKYYTAEDTSEMSTIFTELNNYNKEWRAYFISGQKNLDTDWDEYVKGYENMGLVRYMEIYTKAMEAAGAK